MCRCSICGFSLVQVHRLFAIRGLGVPSPVSSLREWRAAQSGGGKTSHEQSSGGDALGATAGKGKMANSVAEYLCTHCGLAFSSRNRLFKHLGEGCGPAPPPMYLLTRASTLAVHLLYPRCDPEAPLRHERVRLLLLVSYAGIDWHGASAHTQAEEVSRPSVAGAVLKAGLESGLTISSATPLVRTEKGVSAMQNWWARPAPTPPCPCPLVSTVVSTRSHEGFCSHSNKPSGTAVLVSFEAALRERGVLVLAEGGR